MSYTILVLRITHGLVRFMAWRTRKRTEILANFASARRNEIRSAGFLATIKSTRSNTRGGDNYSLLVEMITFLFIECCFFRTVLVVKYIDLQSDVCIKRQVSKETLPVIISCQTQIFWSVLFAISVLVSPRATVITHAMFP